MRRRAIAAAPRAPGASVGDSSSTVASPKAAWVVVPVAEWGAVACAIGAIWLGIQSRRAGVTSLAAIWAPRVGWLTLGLMAVAAFLIAPALYRES